MPYADLPGRLDDVRGRIAVRSHAGGWSHPVRIVAVTKTHGLDAVRAALQAGLFDLGENRIEEAIEKQDAMAEPAVRWHLIGPIQRRKSPRVVGRFELIHSLDRIEVARALSERVPETSSLAALVQVNCSEEAQKGGVPPAELLQFLEQLREVSGVVVRGLMTMAAWGADERLLHTTFGRLRELRDAAAKEGHSLPELSMGMSDDFEIAVEEGATMLRLGTRLFGVRPGGHEVRPKETQ